MATSAASMSGIVDDLANIREYINDKSRPRYSNNIISKYEFNQIISLRTMHLSKGAMPLVELPDDFRVTSNMELRAVALRELQEGRLPYLIKRTMPNGTIEYRTLAEMDFSAVRHLMRPA